MIRPTVTVAIPAFNEEASIEACLQAVARQTYPGIIETLVVDGRSVDRTRELAERHPGARILDNPRRAQSAALNIALAEAKGEVLVRVDGHCRIAADYVERCIAALQSTGAAMVGGGMTPVADGWLQRGIAAAMASPVGAGPARFHVGGEAGWVDSVYLGAYPAELARRTGGYREDVGVNEDSELAIRMAALGGVWYDPSIRSTYTPRSTLRAVVRQFYRYGRSRAATVRHHPKSLAPRQLAAPLLVVGVASPWRRTVLTSYLGLVGLVGLRQLVRDPGSSLGMAFTLPAMHIPWGAGFLLGLIGARSCHPPPNSVVPSPLSSPGASENRATPAA